MKEQEYKAREIAVQKMSREGLMRESLSNGERIRISKRQTDGPHLNQRIEEPAAYQKRRDPKEAASEESERDSPNGPRHGKRYRNQRSLRTGNIRGHPARIEQNAKATAEIGPDKEKAQKQRRFKKEQVSRSDTGPSKKQGRLSFADEGNHMVHGQGMAKKAVSATVMSISASAHKKGQDTAEDNAAVEAAERTEQMAENALRHAAFRSKRREPYRLFHQGKRMENVESKAASRLRFGLERTTEKTAQGQNPTETKREKHKALNRFWQKRRYKDFHQSAKQGERAAELTRMFSEKTKRFAAKVLKVRKGAMVFMIAAILLLASMVTGVSSCGTAISGGASVIIGTTYVSTDEDIYAVEAAYSRLETTLNGQVGSVESRHPGYDEYRYQVDEISHNPYHLISYFTALYGEFTYEQVKEEIEEIFHEQYGMTTDATREVVKEKKIVRVGQSLGKVVTSGYCSCAICCGQWAGGATASGVYPAANHTIAVDAASPFVPMGTKVIMNGVEYVVEDTGNFARYGVQFDVYYTDHGSASAHGHQTWDAYIADGNGSQEIEVTTLKRVNRLDVALKNHGLDAVLRARMDENEEKRYDAYNATYGNRDYLFDKDSLPSYGNNGFRYDIPPEALSDERFARMIREAEKYLGYPYVWGGSSPSTSFDCSGFVSWVVNHCGNGWNFGRQTAESFRSSVCAYVAPQDAKPGDLIFFQGTYNTSGASHIGIYVGNNMMIHCGDPVQYAKINTAYWKRHFLAFGRLP